VQVGVWCGSFGERSANAAALDCCAPGSTNRRRGIWIDRVESIPSFHPDRVDQPGSHVVEFRKKLESCDAVLLAAPEYAGGVAGAVKNALDWLVGSGSLYHRTLGVLSAGTTGGENAIEQLVRTLSWQGALVAGVLDISAPRTKMNNDEGFTDPNTIADIEAWADRVIEAAEGTPSGRLEIVAAVVSRYGIDADRFGSLGR
jgi:chromate reductase, NAD(P)H dehydrogenase (quinone)